MPIFKHAHFYCSKDKEQNIKWTTVEGEDDPLRTILHAKIRATKLILKCGGICRTGCDLEWLYQATPTQISERLKNQDR